MGADSGWDAAGAADRGAGSRKAPSAPTGEQEEPRPAAGESGIEHPSALAEPSTPAVPSPSAEPAAPAEPSAPAGEEEIDDAEVWNCLPRPARRRQPRVQATIVSTAPAQTSGKGKPARKTAKKQGNHSAPPKKKSGGKKTLLQRIQRLDLRVLLVVLIVLIIIALIFGAVLLQQGGVVAAMARGTRASVNRTETAATMPGTMTGKKATLISPYSAMRETAAA